VPEDGGAFGTHRVFIVLLGDSALETLEKALVVDALGFEEVELELLSVAADLCGEAVALRLELALGNVLVLEV
jgi:hypothetical protein